MAKKQKSATNLLEVQNAAKTMFANIRFQSIDNEIKTILITSSVPDEGKTTAACNPSPPSPTFLWRKCSAWPPKDSADSNSQARQP